MRQKLEFILEDVSALIDPSDTELTVFMNKHEERFRQKPQLAFKQIYLNYGKRQDNNAYAKNLLARLQAGENLEQLGDQIMLDNEFPLVSQTDIAHRFGEEFARQIVNLPPGVWSWPVISGFGGHLVLVTEKVNGRMPELAEVKQEVKRDWLLEKRKELQEAIFQNMLAGYEVVIEPPQQASIMDAVAATPVATGAQ